MEITRVKLIFALLTTALLCSVLALTSTASFPEQLRLPQEKHLKNIKQLSFSGENAEAYFSADDKHLIFQSTRDGRKCDQIYTMNVAGENVRMISNGDGRTTCSYFFPDARRVLYSSTHLGGKECPPSPDFSQGYVWAVYPSFDILRHGQTVRTLSS